jgi:hypothetical protein
MPCCFLLLNAIHPASVIGRTRLLQKEQGRTQFDPERTVRYEGVVNAAINGKPIYLW